MNKKSKLTNEDIYREIINEVLENENIKKKFSELVDTVIQEKGADILRKIASKFMNVDTLWKILKKYTSEQKYTELFDDGK